MSAGHKEREHSKFSASGSERWLNCAPSVELEEQAPPSKDTFWSLEGTLAHEVLEKIMRGQPVPTDNFDITDEMIACAKKVRKRVKEVMAGCIDPKLIIEKRVYNNDIHPEMFGTLDLLIVDYHHTLHIMDYKFGSGHVVDPENNTQLIQYALAVLESYDWTGFKEVVCHVFQPRASVKNWHKQWRSPANDFKTKWLTLWKKGVARVENKTGKMFEGPWCHWCRAKNFNCELKAAKKFEKVADKFKELDNPFTSEDTIGFKEESDQKESHKEKSRKKSFIKKENRETDFGW